MILDATKDGETHQHPCQPGGVISMFASSWSGKQRLTWRVKGYGAVWACYSLCNADLFKLDAQDLRFRHSGLLTRSKNLKDLLLSWMTMVIGKIFRTPVFQWTPRLHLLLKGTKSRSYGKYLECGHCVECMIYLY